MIMFLMECDIGYQIILLILRLFCVALFSIDNLSHLYRQCVHAFVRACMRLCVRACVCACMHAHSVLHHIHPCSKVLQDFMSK